MLSAAGHVGDRRDRVDALDPRAGDVERQLRAGHVADEQVEQHARHGRQLEQGPRGQPGQRGRHQRREVLQQRGGHGVERRASRRPSTTRMKRRRSAGSRRWVGSSASITETWLPCGRPGPRRGSTPAPPPPAGRRQRVVVEQPRRRAEVVSVITTSFTVIAKWFFTVLTSASGSEPKANRRCAVMVPFKRGARRLAATGRRARTGCSRAARPTSAGASR